MKIVDPEEMGRARALLCEFCGKAPRSRPLERHHIFTRGMGGGNRLDIPENLIDLGGDFDCRCHAKAQANQIPRAQLLEIVAKRLNSTRGRILAKIRRLQRAPKKKGK